MKLEEEFKASASGGSGGESSGTWTMVNNQGMIVELNGMKYFVNFRYEPKVGVSSDGLSTFGNVT